MMNPEARIPILVPLAVARPYLAWVEKQIAAGKVGPGGTHGDGAKMLRDAMELSADTKNVVIGPRYRSIHAWLDVCLNWHDKATLELGAILHGKLLELDRQEAPVERQEPVSAEIMARLRAMTPEELDYVPSALPPEEKPEPRGLFDSNET